MRFSSMTIVFSGEQNAIVTARSKNLYHFNRRKDLGMVRETMQISLVRRAAKSIHGRDVIENENDVESR